MLIGAVVALAVTGVWLLVAFPFPSLSVLLGVALLSLAVALRCPPGPPGRRARSACWT
ncbi:hypothetical protein ACGF5C_10900 [Micromonospora sp. NPDC047620]|uniref:hypothetical protein n=1 Tax=Micromonospora sp. NPDC047620 TaxID=3364251 RepID=UPI00371EA55E